VPQNAGPQTSAGKQLLLASRQLKLDSFPTHHKNQKLSPMLQEAPVSPFDCTLCTLATWRTLSCNSVRLNSTLSLYFRSIFPILSSNFSPKFSRNLSPNFSLNFSLKLKTSSSRKKCLRQSLETARATVSRNSVSGIISKMANNSCPAKRDAPRGKLDDSSACTLHWREGKEKGKERGKERGSLQSERQSCSSFGLLLDPKPKEKKAKRSQKWLDVARSTFVFQFGGPVCTMEPKKRDERRLSFGFSSAFELTVCRSLCAADCVLLAECCSQSAARSLWPTVFH